MSAPVVLALDIAGRTGFAIGQAGGTPRANSVLLADSDSRARYLYRLNEWLANAITDHEPDLIAMESPQTPGLRGAWIARKLVSAAGVVEMVCYAREVALCEAAPSTIRKHFCGSGRAKKPDVQAECERRGWLFPNADAADALAVFSWASDVVVPRITRRAA